MKVIVTLQYGTTTEKMQATRKQVAEHLGVPLDNVLSLVGANVIVVDAPTPRNPMMTREQYEKILAEPEVAPAEASGTPSEPRTHHRKGKTE